MVAFSILSQHKGTGTDGVGSKITIVNIFRCAEHEGGTGQLSQQTCIGIGCINLDGVLINNINAGDQSQVSLLRYMLALIGKVIVHNLCSSFSIKLGAVGVGYILTQLQLKAQSIIGELPRQSQAGNEVTLTVDVNQSFQDLIQNVAISLTVGGMGNVKTVVGHILRLCDHQSTTTNHTGFNGLLSVN